MTWDSDIVLTYFKNFSPLIQLKLKLLSYIAVMLLMLLAGQSVDNIYKSELAGVCVTM